MKFVSFIWNFLIEIYFQFSLSIFFLFDFDFIIYFFILFKGWF